MPANRALEMHRHLESLNLCSYRDMCIETAKYTEGEMQTQIYRATDSERAGAAWTRMFAWEVVCV